MPYQEKWVPRDIFLEYEGVTVYRDYNNNDYDTPFEYWYTLDEADDAIGFDIRLLKTYRKSKTHKQVLKEAIDKGYVTQDRVF